MWNGCFLLLASCIVINGLLYPTESETRQVKSLDGLWQFRIDDYDVGESERWYALPALPEPTILMPVPASYNDITQNVTVHRHIGWAWYARDFYVHPTASRWVLRFQAVRYIAYVYVNAQPAVNHSGGHLPFEVDITPFLSRANSSSKVRVVVAVNNTLTPSTLPPGELLIHSPTYRELQTQFDFFNYAGIDRSVVLYSTARSYIENISIDTQSVEFDSENVATSATLNYTVTIGGTTSMNALHVVVQLLDATGAIVANHTDWQSSLYVRKPQL